jgi:L-threonylcarbamoyladenylate synthase
MMCLNGNSKILWIEWKHTRSNIVIHPTNSCYGFWASIDDKEAYKRIYEIKWRDVQKPFFITVPHISSIQWLGEYDDRIKCYLEAYPNTTFTFILRRSSQLPSYINSWLETVWIQIATWVLKDVCEYFNWPIFGTSANLSWKKAIYSSQEVQETFWKHEDVLFLDYGGLTYSEPSTIIDLTQEKVQILRWTL